MPRPRRASTSYVACPIPMSRTARYSSGDGGIPPDHDVALEVDHGHGDGEGAVHVRFALPLCPLAEKGERRGASVLEAHLEEVTGRLGCRGGVDDCFWRVR